MTATRLVSTGIRRVIDPLEERLLVDQVLTSLRNGEIPEAGILDLRALSTEVAMKVSAEAFELHPVV